MNYEREILFVLNEAGTKGLSVKKIARHVFNSRNSLFDNVSFDEVHHYVASYLNRSYRQNEPTVERTDVRGVYRICLSTYNHRQLQFDFKDPDEKEEKENTTTEDKLLSLF